MQPQLSVDNGSGFRLSKRASAALAQVIKEFEEEAEDEIVMPRTAHPVPRPSDSDHSRVVNDTKEPLEPGASVRHNSLCSFIRFLLVIRKSAHPPSIIFRL